MIQLLIWPILIPLLLPPVRYILSRLTGLELFSLLASVSILNFIPITLLLVLVRYSGAVAYPVGGWDFTRGIVLCADNLSVFMLLLVQTIFTFALFFSHTSIRAGRDSFFSIFFFALAGFNGMILTSDLFNLYVFLEITAIVSYGMVAYTRTLQGIEGALKYLVMGAFGSFLILFATGLVYSATGSLNLAYLYQVRDTIPPHLRRTTFAMFFSGFALKFGICPVHFWKADAYGAAPEAVSAFLSGAGSKVSIYCMLRIFSTLYGWSFPADIHAGRLIVALGCITLFVGHLMAYRQQMLRRLLAFSSIAHIGYITIAFGIGTVSGLEGALFHMLNHAVLKAGLFLTAGGIMFVRGTESIDRLTGLHQRAPALSISFMILALGMIGIPPVNGFLSKWVIVMSAMRAGYYLSAFSVALAGVLALLYYAKIARYMFMPDRTGLQSAMESSPPQKGRRDWSRVPGSQMIPVIALAAISLLIFVFGSFVFDLIRDGAASLLDAEAYASAVLGSG